MDWYLDATTPEAVAGLRVEFAAFLRRHAVSDAVAIADSVLVLSELATNVWLHVKGPGWVTLDWSREQAVLVVRDLGSGIPGDVVVGRPADRLEGGLGLYLASHLAEELEIAHRANGGAVVTAELPVRRSIVDRPTPVSRSSRRSLPVIDDAGPEGLGREPFLLALTVELARAVELNHGPTGADDAVTWVGLGVGEQLEAEYRRSHHVAGALTTEQVADCLVRLKMAVGGDFFVIDADDERIILGNRRCPFGEAVRSAPSLCAMTSSVFGGIASNATGSATVDLEQRIAVGDARCHVTVWLRHRPELRGAQHFTRPEQPAD